MADTILVSGGAGYIGSHVARALAAQGFVPVVLDSMVNGRADAVQGALHRGDIADRALVSALVREFRPVAALHFAAFIEVGESLRLPEKYFVNNRDKAKIFFDTLAAEGVRQIVFSSTAAVYGEPEGAGILDETCPTRPINPYGQSKLEAETHLRAIPAVRAAVLRYFNVAGAAEGLGEAHLPETHLIPRIVLPLIGAAPALLERVGLKEGFAVYGDDYPTPDGTAVRDYLHVLDLAEAHVRALAYLRQGGPGAVFNLGTGKGYSVREIVTAARTALNRPDFTPSVAPRRPGDPAVLVASGEKARAVLGWQPTRGIAAMIASAARWHRSTAYSRAILAAADGGTG